MPNTMGALFIYNKIVGPYFRKYENKIDQKIEKFIREGKLRGRKNRKNLRKEALELMKKEDKRSSNNSRKNSASSKKSDNDSNKEKEKEEFITNYTNKIIYTYFSSLTSQSQSKTLILWAKIFFYLRFGWKKECIEYINKIDGMYISESGLREIKDSLDDNKKISVQNYNEFKRILNQEKKEENPFKHACMVYITKIGEQLYDQHFLLFLYFGFPNFYYHFRQRGYHVLDSLDLIPARDYHQIP